MKRLTLPTTFRLLPFTLLLAACAAPSVTDTPTQMATDAAPPTTDATLVPAATSTQLVMTQPTALATEATLATEAPVIQIASLSFVNMEVGVTGAATVDPASNLVTLSNDFNISTGPDLYVILSSASDLSLGYVAFSQTVVDAPILYLGELISTTGEQVYTLPAGTDLSQYNTVIVWCRQYSVAFAAAPIR